MDKIKYLDSMLSIISDCTKFEPVNENARKYTFRIEDQINYFLFKLKSVVSITNVSGSAPAFLYCLPKINKPDFKNLFQFRPIFVSFNYLPFIISKYVTKILAPLTVNECTVENSQQFSISFANIPTPNSCYMVSIDADNLFTNFPLSET